MSIRNWPTRLILIVCFTVFVSSAYAARGGGSKSLSDVSSRNWDESHVRRVLAAFTYGGLYGEMFPEREANRDANGKIPLETSGADVLGQTSTDKILAEVCEWMEPESSSIVFPGASSARIEVPGLVDGLLA